VTNRPDHVAGRLGSLDLRYGLVDLLK
jgi:hypothetical protein